METETSSVLIQIDQANPILRTQNRCNFASFWSWASHWWSSKSEIHHTKRFWQLQGRKMKIRIYSNFIAFSVTSCSHIKKNPLYIEHFIYLDRLVGFKTAVYPGFLLILKENALAPRLFGVQRATGAWIIYKWPIHVDSRGPGSRNKPIDIVKWKYIDFRFSDTFSLFSLAH